VTVVDDGGTQGQVATIISDIAKHRFNGVYALTVKEAPTLTVDDGFQFI